MPLREMACAGIGAVFPLIVAIAVWMIVPRFDEVFRSFGASLPWPTRLLLATHRSWALFSLVPVLLAVAWPQERNRGAIAVVGGLAIAGLLFAYALAALYWPILSLAASV